jgi:hypothetical protein
MMASDASRALWNRTHAAWDSDEVLAQVLERGTIADRRALYRRAEADRDLQRRIHALILTIPLPLPRFWLAALAVLDPAVDVGATVPDYYTVTATV